MLEGSMRPIIMSITAGVLLLGIAARTEGTQTLALSNGPAVAADTARAFHGLERLQPGVPVRARFAPYGDSLRPVTELTGTFVEFEPGETLEMDVVQGDRTLLHQVNVEDLIAIEVGTPRRATTRGGMIGALAGAALGLAGTAIAANDTPGDAEYGAGLAIGGFVGAGLGAWFGYRSTEVAWDRLPLYGAMYDDPPVDHD
jgi:hypothetical protein